MIKNGTIVVINDRIGVVVYTGKELSEETGCDLEDHTGVWFGTLDGNIPEVMTIPTEHLLKGPFPVFRH
jgi:hypothetical protein